VKVYHRVINVGSSEIRKHLLSLRRDKNFGSMSSYVMPALEKGEKMRNDEMVVTALILRGRRSEIQKIIDEFSTKPSPRLIYVKMTDCQSFLIVKQIKGESEVGFVGKRV